MNGYETLQEEYLRRLAELEAIKAKAKERGVNLDDSPQPFKSADSVGTSNASLLAQRYLDCLREGKTPQLIKQSSALDGIEIGYGLITIVGAPPGFGKTALAMQIVFDALDRDDVLVATLANAETTFDGLLRRELTRRTKIKSEAIRFGKLEPDELSKVCQVVADLEPKLSRIEVVEECTLGNVKKLIDRPPGLLILDYLQKFGPPGSDARTGVGVVMAAMRDLAKVGWAVVCLSATARQGSGKEAKELSMSSYRDSGEIEFNADSCYLLLDQGPVNVGCDYIRKVELRHVKNRHGAKRDRVLSFHMPRMSFEIHEEEPQRFSEFDEYEEEGSF